MPCMSLACTLPSLTSDSGVSHARILCSNRDEYLARPTAGAHFHSFEPGPATLPPDSTTSGRVLSGRDLRAGGTWLGLNRSGRVAFLCVRPC
jgi:uncharacterized protein with NRDE domain